MLRNVMYKKREGISRIKEERRDRKRSRGEKRREGKRDAKRERSGV